MTTPQMDWLDDQRRGRMAGTSLNPGDDADRRFTWIGVYVVSCGRISREIGPVDTEALRASFVQAQAQIMNNGEYTPVVVIDKGLALGLLDEIERQRRLFAALAQVNGWRDGWMSRAAAEMHTVLDAHQDGEPTPASTVQCMEALIAEWWDEDGEDGDE